MKITSTFGIRHKVYKPDPEKHMSSQESSACNFQEEKPTGQKTIMQKYLGYRN